MSSKLCRLSWKIFANLDLSAAWADNGGMSEPALDIVHQAISAMQGRGSTVRASAASLANLADTAGSAQPAVPRPAPIAPVAQKPAPSPEAPRPISGGNKTERLAQLSVPVLACAKCPHLVTSRTQVVFGVGNPDAEIMFVGEAPGADEDMVGEPFVGKAGQLLTKIIETMGLRRSDVFIANVLKCRPNMPPGEPGNRKPTPAEMDTCKPYLIQQIEIIQPRVIVGLGATAMEGLLGQEKVFITKLRGTWKEFQGIPLMPTYHPSYLLRNQALSEKRNVWEDMLAVLERLGKPITEKQRAFFLPK